jgi:hypothetical protein
MGLVVQAAGGVDDGDVDAAGLLARRDPRLDFEVRRCVLSTTGLAYVKRATFGGADGATRARKLERARRVVAKYGTVPEIAEMIDDLAVLEIDDVTPTPSAPATPETPASGPATARAAPSCSSCATFAAMRLASSWAENDREIASTTITKIIDNPSSVRQAFWSPYKKALRMIEEFIASRAAAAQADADSKLTTDVSAATAATAAPGAPGAAPAAPATRPLDIGVVAAKTG